MKTGELWQYAFIHAPEIPEWFKCKAPNEPKTPKLEASYDYLPQTVIDLMGNWRRDPCFDLHSDYLRVESNSMISKHKTALKKFSDEWKRYWEDRRAWAETEREFRYFAWRRYYADNVVINYNAYAANS